MVLRLVSGILALTFLPIGVIFTVIGLTADEVDEGDPEVFARTSASRSWPSGSASRARSSCLAEGAGAAGAAPCGSAGARGDRERGRQLERARERSAGAEAHGAVRRHDRERDLPRRRRLRPPDGQHIEVLYDPAEPANFEPASLTSGAAEPEHARGRARGQQLVVRRSPGERDHGRPRARPRTPAQPSLAGGPGGIDPSRRPALISRATRLTQPSPRRARARGRPDGPGR